MRSANSRNRRVLVVDDQHDIHTDFKEMLRPRTAQAVTDDLAAAFVTEDQRSVLPEIDLMHAMGGEEACDLVRAARAANRPIAVAYVDIRMPPGIDGVETIRRIRKIDRQIELVIMTAYTDMPLPEIVHDMESLHKLLYIRKPFAREEIQQITLSLVEKWQVEQELAQRRRQLTDSHQRLEAVLDATGDALAMYDGEERLLFANRWYAELLGVPQRELRRMPPQELAQRFRTAFREPRLPEAESRFLFAGAADGSMVEPSDAERSRERRLFYRSKTQVRGRQGQVIGSLYVYRDVSRDIEMERMKAEVLRLRSELETTYSFAGIIGASAPMQRVFALMQRAAESDITVLIRGESGTGKELVAKSFHFGGGRKAGPFVAVNCAAVPETLIESELFGHEPGAFTGATGRRIGSFERADGGTLLLDEIGDMQPTLQAKLLRVLQEREVRRVGGSATIAIDVRVIAATNQNLEAAVRTGEFREDLYYRIAAFPIVIPPLRERREDIPLLANHFLETQAERAGKAIDGISAGALRLLLQYDWPGNVRELENAIARAVLLETKEVLQAHNLSHLSPLAAPPAEPPARVRSLAEAERQSLVTALAAAANNVTQAARLLGVDRTTVHRKLKKYGLSGKR